MENSNISASGYIVTFFNDVESLTNAYAQYSNILAALKGQHPTEESLEKLTDGNKAQALQIIQETRFWVNRSHVKFSALSGSIKEFKSGAGKINALHKKLIEDTTIPKFEDLKEYVIEINKVFVQGVVSTLLTKANEIYAKYKDNTR